MPDVKKVTIDLVEGYEPLLTVLIDALNQAQFGKGKERHANDKPFVMQPIITETVALGIAAPIYQVRKKALETITIENLHGADSAYAEMLGAIVYSAATAWCIKAKENTECLLKLQEEFDSHKAKPDEALVDA